MIGKITPRVCAIALAGAVTSLTPFAFAEVAPAPPSTAVVAENAAVTVPFAAPLAPSAIPQPAPVPPALAAAVPTPPPAETGTPLVLRPSKPLELAHEAPPSSVGWKLPAIVLILGGAAFYARRKLGLKKREDAQLTIVRRATVGFRSELLVVNVEGQRLLLGVTPTSIQSLAVLDAEDTAPAETAASSLPSGSLGDRFAAMLSAAEEQPQARAPKAIADAAPADKPRARKVRAESTTKIAASDAAGPADDEPEVGSQARGLLALRRPR